MCSRAWRVVGGVILRMRICMRPEDWRRMSWHARSKWLKRHRPVPSRKGRPVVSVTVRPTLDDSGIARCGECGAWMMSACGTDHGRRYEP